METVNVELVQTGAKRDAQGRRIESEAERERLMALYDQSGLTQGQFARREGIRYHTFVWWLRRRRERAARRQKVEQPVRFQEYALELGAKESTPLEVRLADGTVLRGDDAAALVVLIKALRD